MEFGHWRASYVRETGVRLFYCTKNQNKEGVMKNGVIIAAKATYDCGKTTAIRGVWLGLKKCGAQEITEPKFYSQGTGQPQDV